MYNSYSRTAIFLLLILFANIELYPKEEAKKKEKSKAASVLPKIGSSEKKDKQEKPKKTATSLAPKKPKRLPGEIVEKKEDLFSFSLSGRKFAQGELLFLKIKPLSRILNKLDRFKVAWEGTELPFTQRDGFILAFVPISPEFSKANGILELTEKNLFSKNDSKKYEIPIQKTSFATSKVSHLTMDKQYTSDELPEETKAFIKECSEAKAKAFQSKSDLQIDSDFEYPVPKPILNSPFYKRRIYNKEKGRPHGGSDFKGGVGDPIFAINDGTVILSKSMYYEGNFIVIDHGLEVYSLYMHQSELLVQTGDKVKKGDLIGKIGSTGMSTGPHLHLGLRVQGVMVDPLSVVQTELVGKKPKTEK
ncbi:M23 family metallopeptidase [Leptospira wolffii]|uniref:M23 family metallopeptidase n=1 Tax=Leptospira wolffii TaxID=409998 RepID=UPI0010832BC0|nr:M23 family metallopeptidase [Leptospira wolffii]TGK61950.1 M23 family metallopeptidase [Leptospira wolffii]TGK68551.1 M23 family metallopeptidase [Leptospira wolffii]TGK74666.1 M23 family metallopeptidase [Leptospira wolffii]TGL31758.1 M23 family metallopeptidase [Leptospira wolffii]